jgi:hypothetical protein
MNGKKIIWIAVAVVVVIGSFLAGMTVGNSTPGLSLVTGGGDYATGYNTAMKDARKKLTDSGLVPPSPAVLNTLSGTVKSVDGDRFVIAVSGRVTQNPLDEQGPAERTVTINDKTKITAQIPMTTDEQTAAMKAFQEAMKSGKQVQPPAPFREEAVKIDALKLGMIVTVTSATDVKSATTIAATDIVFAAIPSTVPVTPPVPPVPPAPTAPKPIK